LSGQLREKFVCKDPGLQSILSIQGKGSHAFKQVVRKVAIIDKNRDLWVTSVTKPRLVKLSSMVTSAKWHNRTDMISGLIDGDLHVWLYPAAAFFDKELAQVTKFIKDTK
jgi:hypothetical protein